MQWLLQLLLLLLLLPVAVHVYAEALLKYLYNLRKCWTRFGRFMPTRPHQFVVYEVRTILMLGYSVTEFMIELTIRKRRKKFVSYRSPLRSRLRKSSCVNSWGTRFGTSPRENISKSVTP